MNTTPWSAADDLGLTEAARQKYEERLAHLFAEGCAIFGPAKAAKLFRDQARAAPKAKQPRKRSLPPRKRVGGHDPENDRLLVMSWRTFNGTSKQKWAEMALKHYSAKNKGKVRGQAIQTRSLVRKLDRLLKRTIKVRQIRRRKPKA